ncbi:hypothetical protein ABGT24_06570 [Peribacillus frigoritolerans]|uniref:hypothetical protein n=1 Tax=Peribacillus frigoritolerans TaxID=450367 RepID=UPI00345DF8A4
MVNKTQLYKRYKKTMIFLTICLMISQSGVDIMNLLKTEYSGKWRQGQQMKRLQN